MATTLTQDQREALEELERLSLKAETGEQWAEIARREAVILGQRPVR